MKAVFTAFVLAAMLNQLFMKKILFTLSLLIFIVSCSKKPGKYIDADNLVVFPKPPDTTRIQFLTTINSSLDVTGEQSGFYKFIFGNPEILPIVKPYGISINKSRIYICDPGISGIEIINLENRNFEYFVPGGMGTLQLPINCTFDDKDRLFVADGNRGQVVVFDHNLKYIDALSPEGKFKPTGICFFNGTIYVAAVDLHKVFVFDSESLKLIGSFPDNDDKGDGYLYQPINITVNDEFVYVTDFGDFNVKKYTHKGEYVGSIGSYGRSYGQFTRPKGIATDIDKNIFVVDAAFENVQVFNKSGNLLMYFGGSYNGMGSMSLPAGIAIDYTCLEHFSHYIYKDFDLKYLIFVSNQFGKEKISVYGFVKPKDN